jgi:hypothetical protein
MATSLIVTGVQYPDGTVQTTAGLTSVVKSIQRGYVSNPAAATYNVTMASVTTSKIMILIDGGYGRVDTGGYFSSTGGTVCVPVLISVNSSTQFTVGNLIFYYTGNSFAQFIPFSWQVIEFY